LSEVSWGQYAEAYKALHDKLAEILSQLSTVRDPTKYLPVRLSDGSAFYNAGGGSGSSLVQNQIRNAADSEWVNEPYVRQVTVQNALDIVDRADRLLGRVYGSQGQQLKQRASTYELLVQLAHEGSEVDPRQIRALTAGDVVSAVKSGTWTIDNLSNPHPVSLASIPDSPNLDVALSTRLRKEDLNLDEAKDLQVDVKSSALPTGASTESTLASLNSKVTACNTGNVAIGSALPSGSNEIGKVLTKHDVKAYLSYAGNPASSGNNTLINAVSGKVIKVHSYSLQAQGTVTCYFRDGATGSQISQQWKLQDREGVAKAFVPAPAYLFKCSVNTALVLNLNNAVTCSVELVYSADDNA